MTKFESSQSIEREINEKNKDRTTFYSLKRPISPSKILIPHKSERKIEIENDNLIAQKGGRFLREMFKLYLVKKFIRIMRESIFRRKLQCLKKKHFDIMNDLSFSPDGTKDISFDKIRKKSANLLYTLIKKFVPKIIENLLNEICDFFQRILSPTNFFRLFWDVIIFIITLIYFIIIPIQIGFDNTFFSDPKLLTLKLLSLALFFIDMLINFNTPFYAKGELILVRVRIFQKYFFGRFFYDFLSISFLIITEILNCDPKSDCGRIAGFLNLLRLSNLSKAIMRFEEFIFIDENLSNLINFINMIFNIFLFSHWSACVWRIVGGFDINHGWCEFYNVVGQDPLRQYVTSLYFVVVVTNTVGFGDITPQTMEEKIFTVIFIYITSIIFAYTINRIGTILHDITKNQREFKKTMQTINGYMKFKNINFGLKIKIRNYLEYIWQAEKQQNIKQSQEIINRLSKSLKEELLLNANGFILKDIPVFNDNFSEKVLRKIAYEMKEISLTPRDIIFNANDINDDNFYVIRDGKVELFMETPNEKTISLQVLTKDQYFGELSFFSDLPRKSSAKSLTFSSLFVIKKSDFLNILKETPEDYEKFCFIRDQIKLYNQYLAIDLKCFSCKNDQHTILECPLLHLTVSKNRVLEKYNFFIPQERVKVSRFRAKKNSKKLDQFMINEAAIKLMADLYRSSQSESTESFNNPNIISQNTLKLEDDESNRETNEEENEKKAENLKMEILKEKLNNEPKPISSNDIKSESQNINIEQPNSPFYFKRKGSKKLSKNKFDYSFQIIPDNDEKKPPVQHHMESSRNMKSNNGVSSDKKNEEELASGSNLNQIQDFKNVALEFETMKNYPIYFLDKNFDILVKEINEKAEKKERRMKTAANLFQPKISQRKISHQFQIFKCHQLKNSRNSHLNNENFFGKTNNKIKQKNVDLSTKILRKKDISQTHWTKKMNEVIRGIRFLTNGCIKDKK